MNLLILWQFFYYCVIVVNVTVSASRRKGQLVDTAESNSWSGKWFPFNPSDRKPSSKHEHCDDGVTGIEIDFSASKKQHNFNYLCLSSNLTEFIPNRNTQTVLKEFYIPPAFEPHSVCINRALNYDEPIPTFGAFRLLAPKYGEYEFLPAQRWVRSLAEGAIVMLYHPCAERTQREELKKLVNACLYRHIITPSSKLSSEYPMALVAWGKLLKLSVVDRHIIMSFIKNNAKKGPFSAYIGNELLSTQYYDQDLLEEAHLVTNVQDTEICAFDIQDM